MLGASGFKFRFPEGYMPLFQSARRIAPPLTFQPATQKAQEMYRNFVIAVFIDNALLHRWNLCHRMAERSFFLGGRQFHLCARCTGLLCGYILSPCLFFLWSFSSAVYFFPLFFLFLSLDGFTQLFGLRESNNLLRFVTGFGFGLSMPLFLARILFFLYARTFF